MSIIITYQLITGIFIAVAASLLGVFAILKRMSLVGDALSHVALPGIALALFLQINPFYGALAFLFVSIIGIWFLEYYSSLTIDTLVGVFFTSALALGSLMLPQVELLDALFGDISKLTLSDVIISVFLSSLLIAILIAVHKRLALNMVSQEMASAIGVNAKRLELVYLMLFALGVALGIKFVGALLMGALIIIPAAAAKNIAGSLHGFMALSSFFGAVLAVIGVLISATYGYPPGPIFILTGAGFFVFSLFARTYLKR